MIIRLFASRRRLFFWKYCMSSSWNLWRETVECGGWADEDGDEAGCEEALVQHDLAQRTSATSKQKVGNGEYTNAVWTKERHLHCQNPLCTNRRTDLSQNRIYIFKYFGMYIQKLHIYNKFFIEIEFNNDRNCPRSLIQPSVKTADRARIIGH